jgi:hypothetical protein
MKLHLKKKKPPAEPKLSSEPVRLALAIPDPKAPHFGSAFLEIAQRCELPLGSAGNLLLHELKALEEAIELFRRRYRHHLADKNNIDSVPGWKVAESQVREIGDTLKAFRLLSNPTLRDAFVEACKLRIGELEKAVAASQSLSAEGATSLINRLFREVISYRKVTRLVSLKGLSAWQQQQRLNQEGEEF